MGTRYGSVFSGFECGLTVLLLATAGCTAPDTSTEDLTRPPGDGAITISGGPEQQQVIDAAVLTAVDDVVVVHDAHDGETLVFRNGSALSASQLREAATQDARLRTLLDNFARNSLDAPRAPVPRSTFQRTGDRTGRVTVTLEDGLTWTGTVESVTDAYLASARVIKVTPQRVFIHQEELGTQPGTWRNLRFTALAPVGAVLELDRQGELLAMAARRIGKERKHPDYFVVDGRGRVSFVNDRGGLEPVALAATGALAAPPEEPAAAEPDAEANFDAAAFRAAVQGMSPQPLLGRTPGPITREAVLEHANAILSTRWTLAASNYAADADNHCNPGTWTRPARLRSDQIGQVVVAPPYQWGGHLGLDGFLSKIGDGALAGDVCTCRCTKQPSSTCTNADWCLVPAAAGLDCSGFIAAVWDIPYEPTGTLPTVSTEKDWRALEPGDMLNQAGHHVRLFVGFAAGDELLFDIIESSVGCGGVCRQHLRVSQLPGYVPYEYGQIRD